ncbi:hypothetical protein [Thauera humireducens]|uniref:hypothetical protein n=1 Tax=Thauera humireducens TaxID=1134435 RepID=UPI00311E2938
MVITYEMHIPQDLWFEPLAGLPPVVMVDANHRLATMSSVDIKELEGDPYILLDLPISLDYFLSIFEVGRLAERPDEDDAFRGRPLDGRERHRRLDWRRASGQQCRA